MLFGRSSAEGWSICAEEELLNRAERDDRFELDPVEMLACMRVRRASGCECLGAWHTHPASPAQLSALDRAARDEGWLSAIVGVSGAGAVELRVYVHGPAGAARELLADH